MNKSLPFDPSRVKRVLIYRLGSLGDTMVAVPALRLVERTFPQARRIMLTNIPVHAKAPAAASILDGSGLVHGYISYPMKTRRPIELLALWWKIRRLRPDVVVHLMPGRGTEAGVRDAKFFRLCGVQHVVGLLDNEQLPNRFDPASGLWEQEHERLLRCLEPLGQLDGNDLREWDLRLKPAEIRKANELLREIAERPYIACGPGTKVQANDWGADNWRDLLTRLRSEFPGHALVLIGAREDAATADHVSAAWAGSAVNLCGKLTPRETAAALRGARLFLGPDSGPKHLAASQGVPCALVFGARGQSGIWYPPGPAHRVVRHSVECEGCMLEVCIEQRKKCLSSIRVEEVLEAAKSLVSTS